MPNQLASLAAAVMLAASPAFAETPKVVADIAPIHALVARVMVDVGEPALLMPPGTSPHHFTLRPTDASALSNADLVVFVGPAFDPKVTDPITKLADGSHKLELLALEETMALEFRENAAFESHDDHGHGHGHEDEPRQEHEAHKEAEHHDHHGRTDPHAWLDPENAIVWLDAIAGTLAELDPAHAEHYANNAAAAQRELELLITDVEAELHEFKGQSFIVFHDAFQYFERRFEVPAAGAIALGDARQPSAERIRVIRATIAETNAICVFREPQHNASLVSTVVEGSTARSGLLDPLGAGLEPGPDLYPGLIRAIAKSMRACGDGAPMAAGATPAQ